MSMEHFDMAMEFAKKIEHYMTCNGVDDNLIKKIEKTFGFKLSPQHYKYYKDYGYLSHVGSAYFGVYEGSFEDDYYENAVIATISGLCPTSSEQCVNIQPKFQNIDN